MMQQMVKSGRTAGAYSSNGTTFWRKRTSYMYARFGKVGARSQFARAAAGSAATLSQKHTLGVSTARAAAFSREKKDAGAHHRHALPFLSCNVLVASYIGLKHWKRIISGHYIQQQPKQSNILSLAGFIISSTQQYL